MVRSFARIHLLAWRTDHLGDESLIVGSIETIAGVPTYVSKPVGEYAKDKAVIIAAGEQKTIH